MRLHKIRLKNVRQFEDATFEFKTGFNLLVGENGRGKSTVLAAIETAPQVDSAHRIRKIWRFEEIRLGARSMEIEFAIGADVGQDLTIERYSKEYGGTAVRTRDGSAINIISYGCGASIPERLKYKRSSIGSDEDAGQDISPQATLHRMEQRRKGKGSLGGSPIQSREVREFVERVLVEFNPNYGQFSWIYVPYRVVVRPKSLPEDLRGSLKSAEIAFESLFLRVLRENPEITNAIDAERIVLKMKSNGSLVGTDQIELRRLVEEHILRQFHEVERFGIEYEMEIRLSPRIAIQTPEGELLLDQLSDGEQRIFSLIADIAIKLLKSSCPVISEGSAVVLIDEIDVHLHPRWQRIIAGILEKIFPNCQFIATTHSPFVIQSVSLSQVQGVSRSGGEFFRSDAGSIEDIAENIQGIDMPQRSARAEKLDQAAERYFKLLRDESACPADLEMAEQAYRLASEPFTSNPALNALLRIEKLQASKQ